MTIEGRVTADGREAVIALEVLGENGASPVRTRIEAVVNTGFTGYLTLPTMRRRLWASRRGAPATPCSPTAARSTSTSTARVAWHGRERPVQVLGDEGSPLAGIALLSGSEFRIRAESGGEVLVEEIT